MRDGNRLKEKIELRLDQRQVVSFVMVALVLSGAIFALGVLVGKNLASMPPGRLGSARNDDLLARLDETAKAGPAARALMDGGPDGLTFQEELTKPEDKRPFAKAPSKPTTRPARAVADGGVTLVAMHATPPATLTPAPAPTAPEATPAEESAEVERPAPPVPSAFFTVQVKATQSKDDADRFVAKLQGSGYHPFVAEVDLSGKGHWYRVRVGKFDTRPKAEKYLADFKRETHLEAFVTAAGH